DYALQQQRQKYASVFQREKQKSDWIFDKNARLAQIRKTNADITETERKPVKEQQEREFKLIQEATKQNNRLQAIREADALKGKHYEITASADGSGRLVKKFAHGGEEYITKADGSFEYNEMEIPVERELADKTKVKIKQSQAYSAETQEKVAKIQGQWNQDRYNADNSEQYNVKRSELQGKIAAAQSRIKDAELAIKKFNDLSPDSITKEDFEAKTAAEKNLSDAKAEKAESETHLNNLKKPNQVVYGGAYVNKIYPNPAALRSVFPGRTDEQIRQTVEANGGKFQQ
ncbi:MAG TPA: hypothetical protein VF692_06870, partial [Pyrinomonadaceae bacterium]